MEKTLKFNSQIATSRVQSERLLALGLKKETADMWHYKDSYGWRCSPYEEIWDEKAYLEYGTPAWSLHRLIEMMPESIVDEDWLGVSFDGVSYYHGVGEGIIGWKFYKNGNVYDCIIDCIEWLIKEGYFNKEYLV